MLEVKRTPPTDGDARRLLAELDAHLAPLYPPESNYRLDLAALLRPQVDFLLARRAGRAVGCVALVALANGQAEIKRLYVEPAARGAGVARALLAVLEERARSHHCTRLLLETGVRQPEANMLYERTGFRPCGPFGNYRDDPLSLFYEKRLESAAEGALTTDTGSEQ